MTTTKGDESAMPVFPTDSGCDGGRGLHAYTDIHDDHGGFRVVMACVESGGYHPIDEIEHGHFTSEGAASDHAKYLNRRILEIDPREAAKRIARSMSLAARESRT